MPAGAFAGGRGATSENRREDYFVVWDGVECAGLHILLDLWGASNLDDLDRIEAALREAAVAAGAEVIDARLHHFGPGHGVTGVLLLAESHISIHTWPERAYAAIDIFMCGACDPRASVPVLERAFQPERNEVSEVRRGAVR